MGPESGQPEEFTQTQTTDPLQIAQLQSDFPKLNFRQAHFAILMAASGNAAKSARESGYSEKTAAVKGYQLLKIPAVRAAVASLQGRLLEAAGTSVVRVLQEVAAIAHAKLGDYVDELTPVPKKRKPTPGDEQLALFPDDELPSRPQLKLKPLRTMDTRAIQELDLEKGKIKLHSKMEAARELLKIAGAYAPEQHEVAGPGGTPLQVSDGLSDTQRLAAIVGLCERIRARSAGPVAEGQDQHLGSAEGAAD